MGAVMSSILQPATKPCLLTEADEYLINGNYHAAIKSYTHCVEEMGLYDKDILANRSLAYLNAGVYSLALLDSETILQIEASHRTATYCKIKCLWGLRQYKEAINFIQTKLSKAQRELPFYKDLEINAHKIQKQSKEEYDMCELLKLPTHQSYDIGEYEGPIEVLDILGEGRGVYATEDLSPGQLVIVRKSFAIAGGIDDQELRSAILTKQILDKLIHKDEFVMNEFSKGAVCLSLDPTLVLFTAEKSEELSLWIQKINVQVNNYMLINLRTIPNSFGIWPSASNFKNDCVDANAHIQFFGDVLMIRALNQIQKGQEITISRFPSTDLPNRKMFMKGEECECKCRLCIFEVAESEEIKQEIEAALDSLRKLLEPLRHLGTSGLCPGDANSDLQEQNTSCASAPTTTESQLRKALLSFKRIAELRAENPTLNTAMFNKVFRELSCLLFCYELFNECVEMLETARPALNIARGITHENFATDRLIISCYLKLGDYNKVKEWVGILKQDLVRAFGTWEILLEFCKDFVAQFDSFQGGFDYFNI